MVCGKNGPGCVAAVSSSIWGTSVVPSASGTTGGGAREASQITQVCRALLVVGFKSLRGRSLLVQHRDPSTFALYPSCAFDNSSLREASAPFVADANRLIGEDDRRIGGHKSVNRAELIMSDRPFLHRFQVVWLPHDS